MNASTRRREGATFTKDGKLKPTQPRAASPFLRAKVHALQLLPADVRRTDALKIPDKEIYMCLCLGVNIC